MASVCVFTATHVTVRTMNQTGKEHMLQAAFLERCLSEKSNSLCKKKKKRDVSN